MPFFCSVQGSKAEASPKHQGRTDRTLTLTLKFHRHLPGLESAVFLQATIGVKVPRTHIAKVANICPPRLAHLTINADFQPEKDAVFGMTCPGLGPTTSQSDTSRRATTSELSGFHRANGQKNQMLVKLYPFKATCRSSRGKH